MQDKDPLANFQRKFEALEQWKTKMDSEFVEYKTEQSAIMTEQSAIMTELQAEISQLKTQAQQHTMETSVLKLQIKSLDNKNECLKIDKNFLIVR